MVAAEKSSLTAAEHRARHDAKIAVAEFALRQIVEACADPRPHQPWVAHPGPRERDHTLRPQSACRQQTPDGDDVLIADMPYHATAADRCEAMDVRPRQAGRMWTVEADAADALLAFIGKRRTWRLAYENRAGGQQGQHLET
jgi:hypothetical protein